MYKFYAYGFGLFVAIMYWNCQQKSKSIPLETVVTKEIPKTIEAIDTGKTIMTRFNPPAGFVREEAKPNSFAHFLRNLPLKPKGSLVHYYDGDEKYNFDVYSGVVDLPIGTKNLHQCADAVMRLRADYLYEQKRYADIHFNFTNGFRVDYSKWMQGQRIAVQGNKTNWVQKTAASNSYESYWNYLETIFMYAGTLSLSKEMRSVSFTDLKIGDVLIQGGSPGHAVIVVDKAINPETKTWVFMLAQSYMPAQEIQILNHPTNAKTVWYEIPKNAEIQTPEWNFTINDLKEFPQN